MAFTVYSFSLLLKKYNVIDIFNQFYAGGVFIYEWNQLTLIVTGD